MKKKDDGRVQIQVRVQPDLRQRLQDQADRRLVSKTRLVERAIEEALERWEDDDLVTSAR